MSLNVAAHASHFRIFTTNGRHTIPLKRKRLPGIFLMLTIVSIGCLRAIKANEQTSVKHCPNIRARRIAIRSRARHSEYRPS